VEDHGAQLLLVDLDTALGWNDRRHAFGADFELRRLSGMIEDHADRSGPAPDALVHERDLVAISDGRSDRILGDRWELTGLCGHAVDREKAREIIRVLGERSILHVHADRGYDRGSARIRLIEPACVDRRIGRANAERDLAVAERVGREKRRDRTDAAGSVPRRSRPALMSSEPISIPPTVMPGRARWA